ncbi:hypothetical protein DQ04_02921030 [Trypanosoma grayi]|uniref:hypothetical protein n=1 Tax=Trypanosoma grayi TaxID=71804 RepID=UPI0004F486DB|nr:hypothetical protein DQ04_02921030 [Trypanosoma grayi]KEG11156.1 hypothetical protein DQ04_02921030 [Trypanosoma grayi]
MGDTAGGTATATPRPSPSSPAVASTRGRRSKETSAVRTSPTPAEGPWRCMCGDLCETSTAFFIHSRCCFSTKEASPSTGRVADTAVDDATASSAVAAAPIVPTVREQMLSSLRAAVRSDTLLGDSLSAAVHAIQQTADEGTLSGKTGRLLPVFLPISGAVLAAAAARRQQIYHTSDATEDTNDAHSVSSPCYTVVPQGLPYAPRIAIANTYRSRAAFGVLDDDKDSQLSNRSLPSSIDASSMHETSASPCDDSVPLPRLPKLRYNPAHGDMSLYVYKRFLPREEYSCENDNDSRYTNADTCKRKQLRIDPPCMDRILRQEKRRIARVPMPVVEWYYPN